MLAGTALFSLGLGAGRAVRPDTPPLVIERRQSPVSSAQTAQLQPTPANTKTENAPLQARPEPESNAARERPTAVPETISICGAQTKKGAPCQRRVRGTDRCWQHKGQPAMIPLEQRIVKG